MWVCLCVSFELTHLVLQFLCRTIHFEKSTPGTPTDLEQDPRRAGEGATALASALGGAAMVERAAAPEPTMSLPVLRSAGQTPFTAASSACGSSGRAAKRTACAA